MALGSVITEHASQAPAAEVRLNIERLSRWECRHPITQRARSSLLSIPDNEQDSGCGKENNLAEMSAGACSQCTGHSSDLCMLQFPSSLISLITPSSAVVRITWIWRRPLQPMPCCTTTPSLKRTHH